MQANDSLPMMDSNSRLVHFFEVLNARIADSNDDFRSEEILASIVIVSSTIPRKVMRVVGPSTFSVFIGAPIRLQSDNMWAKLCWHVLELGGPAVRKSSK